MPPKKSTSKFGPISNREFQPENTTISGERLLEIINDTVPGRIMGDDIRLTDEFLQSMVDNWYSHEGTGLGELWDYGGDDLSEFWKDKILKYFKSNRDDFKRAMNRFLHEVELPISNREDTYWDINSSSPTDTRPWVQFALRNGEDDEDESTGYPLHDPILTVTINYFQ